MKRLFRFQYFTKEDPLLHQVRDLPIVVELIEILSKLGYSYVDSFLNHPKLRDKKRKPYRFRKSDLFIMPTRPPLTDKASMAKRYIYTTEHILEKAMFKQVKRCFSILSRQSMSLHHSLASSLTGKFENRGQIEFYVNTTAINPSAAYNEIGNSVLGIPSTNWFGSPKAKQTSCAYLMFFPATEKLPKMLYVFGMGGQEGLMFARLLKNGLWADLNVELDGKARFIMVEFPIDNIPKVPLSLKFINKLPYEIVLDKIL